MGESRASNPSDNARNLSVKDPNESGYRVDQSRNDRKRFIPQALTPNVKVPNISQNNPE